MSDLYIEILNSQPTEEYEIVNFSGLDVGPTWDNETQSINPNFNVSWVLFALGDNIWVGIFPQYQNFNRPDQVQSFALTLPTTHIVLLSIEGKGYLVEASARKIIFEIPSQVSLTQAIPLKDQQLILLEAYGQFGFLLINHLKSNDNLADIALYKIGNSLVDRLGSKIIEWLAHPFENLGIYYIGDRWASGLAFSAKGFEAFTIELSPETVPVLDKQDRFSEHLTLVPSTEHVIQPIEQKLNAIFPKAYRDKMLAHNGGVIIAKENEVYTILPMENLIEENSSPYASDYFSTNLVSFASNFSEHWLVFLRVKDNPKMLENAIYEYDIETDEILKIAESFEQLWCLNIKQ